LTSKKQVEKIVLISSGQPSLNPRLVKEADTLTDAGFDVTVLYAYWNNWATEFDKQLLFTKKWKYIKVGGSPYQNKGKYWLTRILHKTNNFLARKVGFNYGIAENAIGRCTNLLYREALKHSAAIYIGHNLAALPAVVKAAKKNNAKCGFDAEDYHRNEVSDDTNNFDVKIKAYIENKYFPQTDYLTTSSEQITEKYLQHFPSKKIHTILNVFPKNQIKPLLVDLSSPLKLFWVSQTIGPQRGIEIVIKAIAKIRQPIELHLLGYVQSGYAAALLNLAKRDGMPFENINFHEPVSSDEIFKIAYKFDIGIATETGFPFNRDICLTNKIFTYLQSGLAIIASDTRAQTKFIDQYPLSGKLYDRTNAESLTKCLLNYIDNTVLLQKTKLYNYQLGQTDLNWENEKLLFLKGIKNVLS
jgi:glycosyltransferase involved in cell wall biosynthesis